MSFFEIMNIETNYAWSDADFNLVVFIEFVTNRVNSIDPVAGIIASNSHNGRLVPMHAGHQGPLLLTWFNFNPSMDK